LNTQSDAALLFFDAACHKMANLRKKTAEKSEITLRENARCEFAIAVSHKTDSTSMLNKIANRTYKPRTDWLNHFHSPWKSAAYKVESQNDHLPLT